MGDIRKMEETYEKLCKELDNQFNKELSAGTLDTMFKLTGTVHYLDKMMEQAEEEEEYSSYRESSRRRDGGSSRRAYREGSYRDGGSSREGYESSRRRQRRDNMGRYASRGGDFMAQLEDLMEEAPSEQERQAIRQMMQQMQ